jgi:nitrite reductase/ring-hydroxylating ferredoxin subunit
MEPILLGRADEVPPGASKTFVKHGKKIIVANVDGRFVAYENFCPHMGGALRSGGGEKKFTCGWHGSQFDIASGEGLTEDMIGTRLKTMDVREADGQLWWHQAEEKSPWADDFS